MSSKADPPYVPMMLMSIAQQRVIPRAFRLASIRGVDQSKDFLGCEGAAGHVVGRRRSIQRCLRTLQSHEGEEQYAEGILLYGMGRLGKSSLAARLCERMPGHKRIVFVGALDEMVFTGKINNTLTDPEAIGLLNQPGLNFTQRLRNLLAGPLSTQPVLFVLDDFEQNLEESGDGYIAKSVPLEILKSLLTAIRETCSESRIIVTSRYKFPLPSPLKLREEGLESLRGGELAKKLTRLKAFDPSSSIGERARERARALGAGNPRLLEWLDKILVDGATDATPIMDAMEREAERFRETVLLRELLSQLSVECRWMIALASIYELPFDRQAIAVAVNGPLDPHLDRAVSLGLVERGTNPATGESRYFVSRIALPLVEKETTEEERTEAARRAANYLYQACWQTGPGLWMEEALEIFRLAMEAREQGIAVEVGSQIARRWVNSHRYREAEALCQGALSLGEDHRLFRDLGLAQVVLGRTIEAERNYRRALSLCPDSDVSEKSRIIAYLADLVAKQGDIKRALDLWQQSHQLFEQIGDVQGKAATISNMGWLASKNEDFDEGRRLYFEAGKSLATVRSWLDLITVLGDLANITSEGASAFLAQAAWLTIRVESPAEQTLNVIGALLETLGPEHETAPFLAAAAFFIANTRGRHHPDQEKLINYGMNMLEACASARKIKQREQFVQWFTGNGLNDPERFRPPLSSALEAMVGEDDRKFYNTNYTNKLLGC